MLSFKAIILLSCLTVSECIRLIITPELPNCRICKKIVSEIDYDISSNSTEMAIVKEINNVCKSNQYCEAVLPMVINKLIRIIITKGDNVCTDLHFC